MPLKNPSADPLQRCCTFACAFLPSRSMRVLTAVARRTGVVRTAIAGGRSAACGGLSGEPSASTAAVLCASCPGRPYSVSSKGAQEGEGCRALALKVDGRLPVASWGIAAQQAGGARWSSSSSSGGSAKPLLKPMRSVLYTPGSSRHLYKIREIACDASLIDLEVRDALCANHFAVVTKYHVFRRPCCG